MNKIQSILIVDDTPENLQVLGGVLEQDGFSVRIAVSGADAIHKCQMDPPDLILLDILMPGQDGYEVCQMLKADKALRRTPILFISALDTTEQKLKAFQNGGCDYITKPFHSEEVLARVRTHIQLVKIDELENEVAQRTLALKESNEALDAYCASISHDLRSPACSIVSLCEALQSTIDAKLDPEEKDLMEMLTTSTQALLGRITALLAMSRLDHSEIMWQPVDLSMMTTQIAKRLQEENPHRQVTWVIQPGVIIEADLNLIREVMDNLIGNAWKYSAKSSNATVRFGAEQQDGVVVYFVQDNGAGFSMEQAGALFKMFHRLHTNADYAGDGIGLATVQKIINRHGGKIWAQAEQGVGATFRFTVQNPLLPRVSRDANGDVRELH